MPIDTLVLFVPACFALNMAFGPNNLLSVTIAAKQGMRPALVAAVGRLAAFLIMITVSALGMGALLIASETAFTLVKWAGALYLVWLGVRLLRSAGHAPEIPASSPGPQRVRGLMRQEFLVALGNPKAILIFTAFFPQFVAADHYLASYASLGAIFLILEALAVALYAYAGTRLSGVVQQARGLRWINRVSGSTMIVFGVLLAAARRPTA